MISFNASTSFFVTGKDSYFLTIVIYLNRMCVIALHTLLALRALHCMHHVVCVRVEAAL